MGPYMLRAVIMSGCLGLLAAYVVAFVDINMHRKVSWPVQNRLLTSSEWRPRVVDWPELVWLVVRRMGTRESREYRPSPAPSSSWDEAYVRVESAGWPLAMLYYCEVVDERAQRLKDAPLQGRVTVRLRGAFTVELANRKWFVPLRFRAWGTVVNTLSFATLWFILLIGIRAGVSRWRVRGGCCAKCGYPRTEMGRCPECGIMSQPSDGS